MQLQLSLVHTICVPGRVRFPRRDEIPGERGSSISVRKAGQKKFESVLGIVLVAYYSTLPVTHFLRFSYPMYPLNSKFCQVSPHFPLGNSALLILHCKNDRLLTRIRSRPSYRRVAVVEEGAGAGSGAVAGN